MIVWLECDHVRVWLYDRSECGCEFCVIVVCYYDFFGGWGRVVMLLYDFGSELGVVGG